MRQWINIVEGGNVFKDQNKQVTTQRINQGDVLPTVQWLEQLTGLELTENMLGTTGKKPTSGDLDLAVDANRVSKEQLSDALVNWCKSHGLDPKEYIKKTGISVHFKTPIRGNPDLGYVQTDFMFVNNPNYAKFALSAPLESRFKGMDRHILLNSIGKVLGYKFTQNNGLVDRETNEMVSDDPDEIAKIMLGPKAVRSDLDSVEAMMAKLENDPNRDAKLADARAYFEKTGVPFFESTQLYTAVDEISFLAKLRDRIVNQGMIPIFESDEVVQGGHAKGIEHFEDLVFRRGSAGIKEALSYLDALAKNAPAVGSVKFDGRPAIVWGRNPDGQFVLTDTSGFAAVGYDGLFTSPDALARQMKHRDDAAALKGKAADRSKTLTPLYQGLWPYLEASLPEKFRGYVQGDLLYTSTPAEEKGNLVFTPNTVTYRIPATSKLGQEISDSHIGIAVHTRYPEPGAPKQPIGMIKFNPVDGLLLIQPITPTSNVQPENVADVKILKRILSSSGSAIDQLFRPTELRALQITDLPRLCVDYINSLVKDPNVSAFEAAEMVPGFVRWLQTKVTPRKFKNIVEYLQSPESNTEALSSAFAAFITLHDIKMDLLRQLDRQVPGQEGWVIATPGGVTKFVNRFDFSRTNAIRNNP